MPKFLKKIIKVFTTHKVAIVIILLGVVLRFHNYALFPVAGETADEFAWTFLGASLIQTGEPASWSYFEAYQNYETGYIFGNSPIVKPVFDHPPLFSFLPGLAHTLKNTWHEMPSIKLVRAPMILLGGINLVLFYFVARRLFKGDKKNYWAEIALLIYATVPSFVITSRMILAENLLITWILLSIWVTLNFQKKTTKKNWLIVLSILAILTKVGGVVLPMGIMLWALARKDRCVFMTGLFGLILGFVAFATYGALINWQLFSQVVLSQSGRMIGLTTLQNRLLLHPTIVEKLFVDGWLTLGLLGSVWLMIKAEKRTAWMFMACLVMANWLFIALTVGSQTLHAWYDYPTYPILALAIAWVIKEIWEEKRWLMLGLVWLMLLSSLRLALLGLGVYVDLNTNMLRLIILLGGLPLLLSGIRQEAWAKIVAVALLIILIVSNILGTWLITSRIYSESHQFYNIKLSEV
jgi:4-amino-4-deoxy-L-arabinose transferase-like glycosyltransferase